MSEPAFLDSGQPHEWDSQAAVNFEVTLEIIGNVMAVYTARIAREDARPEPDQVAIGQWEQQLDHASADRRNLRASDPAAVTETRSRYVTLLRALRAGEA